jgi:ADP-ribose pyrophosphatase YjhB (NUDIX family)
MSELRLRQAARAVVLDDADRVLLVRLEFPHWIGWAMPGGGIADGETDEEAIRRELAEEIGLDEFELGPLVWTRTHQLETGDWDGQVARYYVVRTPAFDPAPGLTWAQLNAEFLTAIRWWTGGELEAARTEFAPRCLPGLVRELILHGAPAEPIDAGV